MSDSVTRLLSDAILTAGGTADTGSTVLTHVPQPVATPFASAESVEHDAIQAIDVGGTAEATPPAAFMDGIQRYAVVGRFGLIPVIRGYAAAAVLARHDAELCAEDCREEESVIAPLSRLPDRAIRGLEDTGMPLHDSGGERTHPMVDVHLAGQVVERRREELELQVAREYLGRTRSGWLVVDGSTAAVVTLTGATRILGVVKSHETQYLDGADLWQALTLPAGHRTSVFARLGAERSMVRTWYLRLWPWEGRDLLHGLIRLERVAGESALAEASEVSRWMLAERAPLSTPDGRWDRLIYPIHQVESYLRARAGEWL